MRVFYRSHDLRNIKVGDVVRKFVSERIFTPYLGVVTRLLQGSGQVTVEWPWGSEAEDPNFLYTDVIGQKAGSETLDIKEDTSQLGSSPRRELWVNRTSSVKTSRMFKVSSEVLPAEMIIEIDDANFNPETHMASLLSKEAGFDVDSFDVEEISPVDLDQVISKATDCN